MTVIAVMAAAIFGSAVFVYADDIYWTGDPGGVTSDGWQWTTSSGQPCGTGIDIHPGSSDIIHFIPECTNDALVDLDMTVAGIHIHAGYTGTITTDGYELITSGSLLIEDGVLDASNGTDGRTTIKVGDSWDMTGGTFTNTNSTVMFTGTTAGLTIKSDAQSFNNVIINDGLVGYWRMDETAANSCGGGVKDSCDSSGYQNDGAWTGGATADSTIPSLNFKNEQSVFFDGVSSYVTITDSNSLDFVSNFTIAFWIKPAVLTQSNRYLFSKLNNAGNDNAYSLAWEYTNNTIEFYSGVYTGHDPRTGSGIVLADTNWHHVAYSYNGSTWAGYLDGANVFSLAKTFALAPSTGNFLIGDFNGGGSWTFHGRMDDVRLYNRGLTATEIGRLASGNTPATGAATFSLQDDLDVTGDLYLHSGTLDVNGHDITLAGDWLNTGGIFDEETRTVTLDGSSQAVEYSETFYNFDKTTASTDTLTFGKDSTITVTSTLTLDGDASNLLSIRSSTTGTRFEFDVPGAAQFASYVNVKDSETSSNNITGSNSIDSGNTDSLEAAPHWVLPPPYTLSGTCDQVDQTTDCTDTGTVRVAYNATLQAQTQLTVAGTWSIAGLDEPNSGDIITVFIDGASNDREAVAVTKYDGTGSIAGVTLFEEHLTIGSNDTATTMTNANLANYDNSVSGDEDIFFDVNALNNLTVDTTGNLTQEELYIKSGWTFRPDSTSSGNVTTHDLEIDGTFTADGNTIIFDGSWDNDSTFSSGTSTVMFTGTGASETLASGGSSFNNFYINDGLVGYWRMDETAANSCVGGVKDSCDISGYNNDGAWFNAATADASIPTLNFKNERSVVFDGVNAHIKFADSDSLDLVNNFTIAFWMKPANLTQSNRYILSKTNAAVSDNSYSVIWEYVNNNVEFYAGGYTGDDPRTGSTIPIPDTNWHHVAYTYDGSTWKGYADATPSFSLAKTFTLANGGGSLVLGDFSGAGAWDFNGKIDDLRIYKRALSQAEISALAAGNQPDTGAGTLTIQDALDVNGHLYLNSGTLDTKIGVNNSINLAGDWNNFGGIFIERSSTVTLDGTNQTISASETFYDLIKTESNDNSTDETLTFGKNATIIISNDWTLDGRDADDRINLESSTSGTAAKVNPQGTRTLDFLDVKDSNNINSTAVNCPVVSNCVNSGGNTNWTFGRSGPLKGAIMMVEQRVMSNMTG